MWSVLATCWGDKSIMHVPVKGAARAAHGTCPLRFHSADISESTSYSYLLLHPGRRNCLHVPNYELSVMNRVAGRSRFFTCGHHSGSSTGCLSSSRTDVIHTLPSPRKRLPGHLNAEQCAPGRPRHGDKNSSPVLV